MPRPSVPPKLAGCQVGEAETEVAARLKQTPRDRPADRVGVDGQVKVDVRRDEPARAAQMAAPAGWPGT